MICDLDLPFPFSCDEPLRSLDAYALTGQTLDAQDMLSVQGARVVMANYRAITQDFGHFLFPQGRPSPSPAPQLCKTIDQWLITNTAFISLSQAVNTRVSTPVIVGDECRIGWRAPRYGRAAVMCDCDRDRRGEMALFDVKGCGVPNEEEPVLPHSNGLLTLNEAVHEVLFEHIVWAIAEQAGANVSGVPNYAIVDLGFDAKSPDASASQRACLLIRRAVTRPRCQWSRSYQGPDLAHALLEIEMLLRRHGVSASSCGAVRIHLTRQGQRLAALRDGERLDIPSERLERIARRVGLKEKDRVIDGVNVQIAGAIPQLTAGARIMDFGRYRFRSTFENVLYSWWDADYSNLNGELLIPTDAAYQQPIAGANLGDFAQHSRYRRLGDMVTAYERREAGRAELAASLRDAINAARSILAGQADQLLRVSGGK